ARTARSHIAKDLEGTRVCDLSREIVEKWHRKVASSSSGYVANRSLQLLRAALNHAKVSPNPAAEIELYGEEKRERFVKEPELPLLFASLREEDSDMRDVFELALYTGARRAAVICMRFDEIPAPPGDVWHIPSSRAKG